MIGYPRKSPGPFEFGDATDYEERYEDLLEAKTDIGKQVADYNRAQTQMQLRLQQTFPENLIAAVCIPSAQDVEMAKIDYRLKTRGMDREDLREAMQMLHSAMR